MFENEWMLYSRAIRPLRAHRGSFPNRKHPSWPDKKFLWVVMVYEQKVEAKPFLFCSVSFLFSVIRLQTRFTNYDYLYQRVLFKKTKRLTYHTGKKIYACFPTSYTQNIQWNRKVQNAFRYFTKPGFFNPLFAFHAFSLICLLTSCFSQ